MSAALSFALISVFALGIPTCALSFVVLNRSRDVDRCFLAFQFTLLLLMLADALIFFRGAGGSVASSGQADPMPILFVASHALQCLLAVSLFLLAAEITAMDRRSAAWKIGMACVVFISAGVCWYAFAVQHGDAGYFDKIRHFDPGEALGLVIFLYPITLVLLRLSRIKEKRMAKAVIPFLALGVILIPAALIEDYALSSRSAPDLLFVFPFWYLAFNALILYYGVRYFFIPRSSRGTELDPAIAARISRRFCVSPREEEVVHLLLEGKKNSEIAAQLNISPATVRNHIHSVYGKTGAGNRVELTRLYTQR